ncbi:MAG TPA: OmpH family outer membrane protein [Candidatus Hydrogenedentes bacterium]|nr:OmpH family outer membrane protein [Candidatus Hydrogenedentota bacterium]HOL78079.1 OmpH family outer membrane protein [Candidatus Hydrogenedentota bacterium]HPO86933.1 OmpH family outer membrane protein [Candidatus Hydrogenedentota bacterium]
MKYCAFRKLLALAVLTTLVVLPAGICSAQDTDSAASKGAYKIGIVDRKKVFDNYNKQKEEYAKLQNDMKSMQAEIDTLSKKVQDAKERYEANKNTMPADQREALEQQIRADMVTYKSKYEQLQTEIDTRYAFLVRKIKEEIDEVVREVGAEENYHLILEGDPKSASGVLYYASAIDMTSKILDRLNARSASGQQTSSAAAPNKKK